MKSEEQQVPAIIAMYPDDVRCAAALMRMRFDLIAPDRVELKWNREKRQCILSVNGVVVMRASSVKNMVIEREKKQ